MKISQILELLLILIIIAFAASKPYHKHNDKYGRQSSNADSETYDDGDDDDDDFFGLDAEDLDDDDDRIANATTALSDNLDESDSFLLFGDDFLAVFDDDETDTKKKEKKKKTKLETSPADLIPNLDSSQSNIISQNSNPQLIPIETVQTVVNQLTEKNDGSKPLNKDKQSATQLNLQHTSALLELVQNSNAGMNYNNLTIDDDFDNQLKLDGDNFLNSTLNDEEKLTSSDDENISAQPLTEAEEQLLMQTLNKVKQQVKQQQQQQQQLQQAILSTSTVAPTKKLSTTAKPSTGLLGIVEDLIEDDDDDEEVPENEDDDDDDDDEEDSEEVTKKPSTTTTTTTTVKPSKTKRPTSFIDVIGDTLGL
ncbi:probable serine/threonine-protein kinase kinX [Condylostylus longicornis]|uniref:probable serine/threonine-protein kinase kinX n=1 Tax=Condylostylus longicornis TaxID=2530218 RepID=UPI00244E38E3|nr:probable serine/threonine-protein kinase kinX [Condylostylus longicornis]